jgi:hypothetical protein
MDERQSLPAVPLLLDFDGVLHRFVNRASAAQSANLPP